MITMSTFNLFKSGKFKVKYVIQISSHLFLIFLYPKLEFKQIISISIVYVIDCV